MLARRQDKWDQRFLEMASLVSTWSKDPSTKCGAVIVRPDLTICSVGYNGFPRYMSDAPWLYEHRETKYSRVVHCEVNALIAAAENVSGYTLYTTGMCCDRCAVQLIQAGVGRFVWWEDTEDMKSRWGDAFKKVADYYEEADVQFTEVQREV
jgi:dCMP deaminase